MQTCAQPSGPGPHEAYFGSNLPAGSWLRSACRFWDALAQVPVDSLWRAVALSDWGNASCLNVNSWAWSIHRCLSDLRHPVRVDRHFLPLLEVTVFSGSTLLVNSTAGRCLRSARVPALQSRPALKSTCGGLHCLARYVQRIYLNLRLGLTQVCKL